MNCTELKTTDPTSRQRKFPTSLNQKPFKVIQERKKNWPRVRKGSLTPRQTGRLTIGQSIT
jgi:hypothetical protein